MVDDKLKRAAKASGLESFLETDPDGFTRAFNAAAGYRERRLVVETATLEPAHCFRVEAGATRSDHNGK